MILVCPSCDSKFNVPDNAIPPEGRKVRCAQCGSAWHATTANELKPAKPVRAEKPIQSPTARGPYQTPPVVEVDAGIAAKAAAIRRSVIEKDTQTARPEPDENLFDEGIENPVSAEDSDGLDDFGDARVSGDSGDSGDSDDFGLAASIKEKLGDDFDLDDDDDDEDDDDIMARRRSELRRKAERKSSARNRQLLTIGWATLLIFIVGVLGSLVFAKDVVTKAFPGTHQLYDFFAESRSGADKYLPAEGERVTPPITETEVYVKAGIIQDRTRLETVDGQSLVVIGGELENTGNRAANVPKVEISIKDRQGNVLDQWVFDPPGLVLRRLSKLPFETRRPAPTGMASVAIRALEGTKSSNEAPSRL